MAGASEHILEVLIGLTIFVIALVMLGVFTSGLTQQYIIGGSGARQPLGRLGNWICWLYHVGYEPNSLLCEAKGGILYYAIIAQYNLFIDYNVERRLN